MLITVCVFVVVLSNIEFELEVKKQEEIIFPESSESQAPPAFVSPTRFSMGFSHNCRDLLSFIGLSKFCRRTENRQKRGIKLNYDGWY